MKYARQKPRQPLRVAEGSLAKADAPKKPIGTGSPKTKQHRDRDFVLLASRLGQRIRELRTTNGWTIEAAAEHMQIEPSHLRRLEAGTANPTLALLLSAAKAFNMALIDLLGNE